jgi:hypothetical protein
LAAQLEEEDNEAEQEDDDGPHRDKRLEFG